MDNTAPSTSDLVSFPPDHLEKSELKILIKVGTMIFNDDCIIKFPPLRMTLKGKREGGTKTLITSFVSLFNVFLPCSSAPTINQKIKKRKKTKRMKE